MVLQDTSALPAARLLRGFKHGLVGLVFALLLTPITYVLVVLSTPGGARSLQDAYGFLVLGTFQYQLAPQAGLYPTLALLVLFTVLGLPRIAPWTRLAVLGGAAVVGALVTTLLIAPGPDVEWPQLVAMGVGMGLGWSLSALPLRGRRPGWGRP